MSYRYVLQYLLSENHKIAIISRSTADVREKQALIWSNWNFGRTHSIKAVFYVDSKMGSAIFVPFVFQKLL
jgi:hypothetical protein